MTETDERRIYDICYKSKQGATLTAEEQEWCWKMHRKHPKKYKEIARKAADQAVEDYKGMFRF